MRFEWPLPGRGLHVGLPKAPGRHLDALSRLIRPRPSACLLHWHPARRIKSIRTRDAVATTIWYRERLLSVADTAALIREVLELFRYTVNVLA
jgi:hypothetical protein